MKRMISDGLLEWKNKKDRKPLLIEGVRQCGKTYILKEFGATNYKDYVYFNFEKTPELCDIFESDLDPKRLIERLGLRVGRKIEPESTLIIFDEISFCNRALTSLKYFCEDAPEYHIACAGSYLGVLTTKPYPFPVGKVDRLRMWPMTFKEFLLANSEDLLVEKIDRSDPTCHPSGGEMKKMREYLDYYLIIGGMPAAVSAWVNEKDIEKVENALDGVIADYKDDLTRHASESFTKLMLIWESIPIQLAKENKKFMFGHVRSGARAKDLDDALLWLINAGMVHKIRRVDPPKVPLPMNAINADFKIYLADVGILRRMAKLPPNFIFSKDKEFDAYRGILTENYVLNEIIASTGDVPYYWRSNNTAEVDFIAQVGLTAAPIEVKAGSNKSRSLTEYINKYSPQVAVIASMQSGKSGILSDIPLYAAWKIVDHIREKTREE